MQAFHQTPHSNQSFATSYCITMSRFTVDPGQYEAPKIIVLYAFNHTDADFLSSPHWLASELCAI